MQLLSNFCKENGKKSDKVHNDANLYCENQWGLNTPRLLNDFLTHGIILIRKAKKQFENRFKFIEIRLDQIL